MPSPLKKCAIGAALLLLSSLPSPLAFAQAPIEWRTPGNATAVSEAAPSAETFSSGAPRHVVVQFTKTPGPEERAAMEAGGLTLQTYLGSNAYFAHVAPGNKNLPTALSNLVLAQEIDPAWKTHPMIAAKEYPEYALIPATAHETGAASKSAKSATTMLAAYAIFHADVDAATAGAELVAKFGGEVRDEMLSINALVVWIPLDAIEAFIAEDGVQWLEPPLPPMGETNNSNRIITQVDTVNAAPYNLDGEGVTVLVYDAGKADETHPDFAGRLSVRDNSPDSDHAMHVAGTVAGSGANSVNHGGTPNQWRGMAPGATVESYGFQYDGSGQFLYTNPGDIEADYDEAINTYGAMIANNSIGTNVAPNGFPCEWEGDYGATSQLIDAIVRGSLGAPMRIIWANGNERGSGRCGTTYNTTAPPAGAKNHITVGAMNSNDDSVSFFTSWGPTDDGRMKPDVSAPGCQTNDDGGVTSSVFGGGYDSYCGTSMASPTVAGIGALLLQDFMAQYPGEPLPRNSTLKVLLAQNAQDLGNVGPDFQSGFGSVRVQATVDFQRSGRFFEAEVGHGQIAAYTVGVAAGTPNLKVTIAWDDPPGAANTIPELVNDLDLICIDPNGGVTRFPWTLNPASPSSPAVRTQADRRNNIEQVLVDNPTAGTWQIQVIGYNVPQGPQVFSLAANGSVATCTSAGTISLDSNAYSCSDTAIIRVADCDLNTNPTAINYAVARIASNIESAGENVTLTETDVNSGTFVGSIPLSTTNAPGVLHIFNGGLVRATYNDANNGSGAPATVIDEALVDCVVPTLNAMTFGDIEGFSATGQVAVSEQAYVEIQYGTVCGAPTESVFGAGAATSHAIPLIGLEESTTYYANVIVTDLAGNVLNSNNGGACFTFTTASIPDYFTELFTTDFDLDNTSVTFTPDGSADFYQACARAASALPTDPTGGTTLSLPDDFYATVALGGPTVSLYGVSYGSVHVGSNGYLTFSTPDSEYLESLASHFSMPRVAALFDDLNPSAGGTVSYRILADRLAVSYLAVPEYSPGGANTFQIEMFFDGRIRITWLDVSAVDGLAGLSFGGGVPADFVENDISAYDCGSLISGVVTHGGVGLEGVTLTGFPTTVVTGPDGAYEAEVPVDWSGVVTPALSGYVFMPEQRSYDNLMSDLSAQNYTAHLPGSVLYSTDFEGGLDGFSMDNYGNGLWHRTEACEAETGQGAALYYGVDALCSYDAGNTAGYALSPLLDLSASAEVELSFAYFLQTEFYPSLYDRVSVVVIASGGTPVKVASNDPESGLPLLYDPSGGWRTMLLDLSLFAGQLVQIGFHFETMDDQLNYFSGFYIDDVVVTGDGVPACQIEIQDVSNDPNPVLAGGEVAVGVDAINSASGSPLHYQWSATAGYFTDPNAASTYWIAPEECIPAPGEVQITVDVFCAGDSESVSFTQTVLPSDTDNDGLDNCEEATVGTNPLDSDTDDDGIPDGTEVNVGTDPTDNASINPNVYVDGASGSDTEGFGTMAHPWATVGHAVAAVVGNETNAISIHVAKGRYTALGSGNGLQPGSYEHVLGGYNRTGWTRDVRANETILDASESNGGSPAPSVVRLYNLQDVKLDGLTLTGADSTGAGIAFVGAVMYINVQGDSSIIDCVISGNVSSDEGGGGISVTNSALEISGTTIAANSSLGAGGGLIIFEGSDVHVDDCDISGNDAVLGGGGIYVGLNGRLEITNSIISGNGVSNGAGGGLVLSGGELLAANCTVAHNVSSSPGGGIAGASSTTVLVNVLFANNVNGAIAAPTGPTGPFVEHCLFEDNTLYDYYNHNGGTPITLTGAAAINAQVANATGNVDGNPEFLMTPVGNWTASPTYNGTTGRTTFTAASAGFTPDALRGRLIALSPDGTLQALVLANTATTVQVAGNYVGIVANGTAYRIVDYRIAPTSAAVDFGRDTSAPVDGGVTEDFDGVERGFDGDGLGATTGDGSDYDIGAFESDTVASANSITVLYPNGGESIARGQTINILWSSTGNIGPNVKILARKGTSFAVVATSTPNTGSYTYPIPGNFPLGPGMYIEVSSIATPSILDISDGTFTITSAPVTPTITVTAPNGGESYVQGATVPITWTSTGTIGTNVEILAHGAGQTVSVIGSTPNDGSHNWVIPAGQTPGTNYTIQVRSVTTPTITDSSNAPFTITGTPPAASITILSPNGGESIARGETINIQWTSTGNIGANVKILARKGTSSVVITNSTPNDGTHIFQIPATYPLGPGMYFEISSVATPSILDICDGTFTITSTPVPATITVLTPNGGESYVQGATVPITWSSTGSIGSNVEIRAHGAGQIFTVIASTPNDGAHDWVTPANQAPGTNYAIEVRSVTTPAITDSSNAAFSITATPPAASITVLYPNGGESIARGQTIDILWSSTGDVGANVKILARKGTSFAVVANTTPNDGTFSYTLPTNFPLGPGMYIEVSSITTPAILDISDGTFTVTSTPVPASITVTAPNGGESFVQGTTVPITWTFTGTIGSNVEIRAHGAGQIFTVVASTPNDGAHDWVIPASQAPGTNYTIEVRSVATPAITDSSNAAFSITATPPAASITILAPNGGESFARGQTTGITWDSTGAVGANVKIVARKGTSSAVVTNSTPNDGSFAWQIPTNYPLGPGMYLEISSVTTPTVLDISDGTFTITP